MCELEGHRTCVMLTASLLLVIRRGGKGESRGLLLKHIIYMCHLWPLCQLVQVSTQLVAHSVPYAILPVTTTISMVGYYFKKNFINNYINTFIDIIKLQSVV